MSPVVLKGIGALVALAGATAAGVGISHAYSGSSNGSFDLASERDSESGEPEELEDKRNLSFDENDTNTDKEEWKKKLGRFKKNLEKNKKSLKGADVDASGRDEDNIKKLKKACSDTSDKKSKVFGKWCMVKKTTVSS